MAYDMFAARLARPSSTRWADWRVAAWGGIDVSWFPEVRIF